MREKVASISGKENGSGCDELTVFRVAAGRKRRRGITLNGEVVIASK